MVWRILFWWRLEIVRRRSGRRWRDQRGFCNHDWRTLGRGRDICGWRGFRPFPAFPRFSTVQDYAAVFGHTRTAGLNSTLLQDFRNDEIGRILAAQFHDGVMEWF